MSLNLEDGPSNYSYAQPPSKADACTVIRAAGPSLAPFYSPVARQGDEAGSRTLSQNNSAFVDVLSAVTK